MMAGKRSPIPRLADDYSREAAAKRAGGVTTTEMDDRMQRSPAFCFDSARQARSFGQWVTASFGDIKRQPEAA
jgi:hydroxymethylglutaryl-CoA reductase (NADPH)